MFPINVRLKKSVIKIFGNGGTLESVPNRYKTKEMCDKAVDNYAHALKFVPDPDKTKKCVLKLLTIILLQ